MSPEIDPRDGKGRARGRRWGVLLLGIVAYLAGVRSLVYFVLFVSRVWVSRTVDEAPGREADLYAALAIDLSLLSGFVVGHSLMARNVWKRRLSSYLPDAAQRAIYVLVAAATLSLLMWQWRPIAAEVWHVEAPAGRAVLIGMAGSGWLLAAASILAMGHAQLFGLRQALALFRGDPAPAERLVTEGLYRYLRDPMFCGFAVGIWSTPRMTLGHLLLAVFLTGYLVVGAGFERRDLRDRFGDRYAAWLDGSAG